MRLIVVFAVTVLLGGCSKKEETPTPAPGQVPIQAPPAAPAQPQGQPAAPGPAPTQPQGQPQASGQPSTAPSNPVASPQPTPAPYTLPAALPKGERKIHYPKGNKKLSKQLNSAALKARKAGENEAALSGYIAAVQASPGWAAPRFNLACEYARFGKADQAIAELDHLLRIGDKNARKYASKARTDPDFDPIRSDPRLQTIANDFNVDFDAEITKQLCADFGKVGTLVNAEQGLYQYFAHKDRAIRLMKGGKARGAVYKVLETWCRGGRRHAYREMGIKTGAPSKITLSKWKAKYPKVCLTGSCSGVEIGAGDIHRYETILCFINQADGWVLGVAAIISGMDDGSGAKMVKRATRKAKKLYGQ